MPISEAQTLAIKEVIEAVTNITQGGRYKRFLADNFLDVPSPEEYPDYLTVISKPRSINGVEDTVDKQGYESCLDVLEDLELVFQNALYYNEEDSPIATDAEKLRYVLHKEWKARQILPSPPEPSKPTKTQPGSPQAKTDEPMQIVFEVPSISRQNSNTSSVPPSVPVPVAAPVPGPSFRPVAPRPRSPSPEMDVDVERGTPEPEGGVNEEEAREDETLAIISQLEKGLPRWTGFENVGWNENLSEDKMAELVSIIKNHKHATYNNGQPVSCVSALEGIPADVSMSDLPFMPTDISLDAIESKVQSRTFKSSAAFDEAMSLLFLKGRRYHDTGSEQYGRVCHLQRLYQALTSKSPPSGPPYVSNSGFCSVRAGPGTARPMYGPSGEVSSTAAGEAPGVTMFRVSSKDRTFVEDLHHKGWSLRLGDWVHLSNPDDASRPIIGQVFRCFISEDSATRGKPGITVCWYYRPEQTTHPLHRLFWENEVFKTSHFADHTLDDLIEKISLQFTARHIRGRPRPPFWSPGWPLYVCDSRYNDRERCFVKIKNWSSCVPEEVRKRSDWMPIYPFERMVYPRRYPSPFVKGRGIRGTGGIGDSIERSEGEKIEGGGTGRKRTRKNGSGTSTVTDIYGPTKGPYVGPAHYIRLQQQEQRQSAGIQAQSHPAPAAPMVQSQTTPQLPVQEDRSIVQAAGGPAMAVHAHFDKMPLETTKCFERDPQTNEVLWFAAPPVNISREPGPSHSLAYLHFLARKRKQVAAGNEVGAKRPKPMLAPAPTLTQTLNMAMAEGHLNMP